MLFLARTHRLGRPATACRLVCCVLGLGILFGHGGAKAEIWRRMRPNGTVEFTNLPPSDKGRWQRISALSSSRGVAPSPQPSREGSDIRTLALRGGSSTGMRNSVIWTRENENGTVEFTNLSPVGARWKVLYRFGPGKASTLRGTSDIVPPRDRSNDRFRRYERHIQDQQAFYGIPPALMRAVIKVESDFDPHVVSSAGAVGLTQMLPGTARSMGVTDIWDPRQNIMGGARYLQTLVRRFCRTPIGKGGIGFSCSPDETIKVLAGYHAGPGAVEKYKGLPPFETTRAYVTMVLTRYEQFRVQEALTAPPSTVAQIP